MVKTPATFTIERGLLKRLDNYARRHEKVLGGRRSKSSIVEEGLANLLFKLEKELRDKENRDISVVR